MKRIFLERPGGRADDAATREIQELCLGALRAVNDSVCGGKLVTIHACAAALYSDKAHRHWDSPNTVGVDRLRQRIFRALNAYERRLLHLDVRRLDDLPHLRALVAQEGGKLLRRAGA